MAGLTERWLRQSAGSVQPLSPAPIGRPKKKRLLAEPPVPSPEHDAWPCRASPAKYCLKVLSGPASFAVLCKGDARWRENFAECRAVVNQSAGLGADSATDAFFRGFCATTISGPVGGNSGESMTCRTGVHIWFATPVRLQRGISTRVARFCATRVDRAEAY